MADELDLGDESTPAGDLRKNFASQYRKQGQELSTTAAERDALVRENALLKSGLELDEPKQKALLAVHSGEMTAEALKATAATLGFTAAAPPPPANNQAAAEAQAAASGAGSGTAAGSSASDVLTAETLNGWSTDRLMAFQQKFPDQAEAILRGESVNTSSLI